MFKSVRYDAVKDFAPVALVAGSHFVFVARKDFPANDIKGLIALAKASPGKLNFASVGLGSTQHFAGRIVSPDDRHRCKAYPLSRHAGGSHCFARAARSTMRSSSCKPCKAKCSPAN